MDLIFSNGRKFFSRDGASRGGVYNIPVTAGFGLLLEPLNGQPDMYQPRLLTEDGGALLQE